MAATVDLEVSRLVRERTDPNAVSDYARFRMRVVRSGDPEWDAIQDREAHVLVRATLTRGQAQLVERKCEALVGRGSIPHERLTPLLGPRGKAFGSVAKGWFVSPDGTTVQGCWSLVHYWGESAVLEATIYRDDDSLYGKPAKS